MVGEHIAEVSVHHEESHGIELVDLVGQHRHALLFGEGVEIEGLGLFLMVEVAGHHEGRGISHDECPLFGLQQGAVALESLSEVGRHGDAFLHGIGLENQGMLLVLFVGDGE